MWQLAPYFFAMNFQTVTISQAINERCQLVCSFIWYNLSLCDLVYVNLHRGNIIMSFMPWRYYCMRMIGPTSMLYWSLHLHATWGVVLVFTNTDAVSLHVTPMWPVTKDTNCGVPPHLMYHMVFATLATWVTCKGTKTQPIATSSPTYTAMMCK